MGRRSTLPPTDRLSTCDSYQFTVNPNRLTKTLYRPPVRHRVEEVDLEWAMDRIAQLTQETRDETFVEHDSEGRAISHTLGVGFLGGATLDIEESYLIKKLCIGAGVVFVRNQARI